MKLKDFLVEQDIINEANLMMEMANLTPDETGIQYVIWMGRVSGQHGPRIKVSNKRGRMIDDYFVMTVSKNPIVQTPKSVKISQDVVDDISDWIVLNYDVLMKLWDVYETGKGKSAQLLLQFKKIRSIEEDV
jgi:hypothetical protein